MATVYVEVVPTYLREAWDLTKAYQPGDRVSYNSGTNKIYVCIVTTTIGEIPSGAGSADWVLAGSKEYPFQLKEGQGNAGVASTTSHGEFNLQHETTIKTTDNFCRDAAGVGGTIILGDGVYDINGNYNATTNALDLGDGINLTALNNRKARVTFKAYATDANALTCTGTMTGIRFGFRLSGTNYPLGQGLTSLKLFNCTLEDSTPYGDSVYSGSGLRFFWGCNSFYLLGTEIILLHTCLGTLSQTCKSPSAIINCTIYMMESGQYSVVASPLAAVEVRNSIIYCKKLQGNYAFIENSVRMSVDGLAWFVEDYNGKTPVVGGAACTLLENVLNIDPEFVDEPNGNLELRPSSPLIGASAPPPVAGGVAGDYYFAVSQQGIGDGSDADNAQAFSPANLATAEAAANSLSTIYFLPGTYTLAANLTFDATSAPGLTYQSTEPNKAILDCSAVLRAFYFNQTATFKDFSTKNCWFSVVTEYTTVTVVGLQHEQTFATDYGAPFSAFLHAYAGAANSKALILKECSFALEFSGAAILIKMSGHTFSAENCAFYAKASSVSAGAITNNGVSTFWTFKNTIFTSDNSSAFGLSLATLSTSCCFYEFGSSNTSGGTNNIFVDPQFVGASTGNLKLRPTSPCIGASLGASAPSGAIYVFNGTQSGTADGSYGDPYDLDHIGDAETAAASGGVIIFKDGTYTLTTHLDLSGSSTNSAITYRPETVGGVTITGQYGLRIGNGSLTKAVSFNDFIISIGDISEFKNHGLRVMNGAGGSISLKGVKGTIRLKHSIYANAIGDNSGHNYAGESFDCYLNECSFSVITDDDPATLWYQVAFLGAGSNLAPGTVGNFTINNCSFYSPNANSTIGFCMYNTNGPVPSTGTVLVNNSIIYHDGLPGQIKMNSINSEVTLSKCCYYKGWTNPGTSFPNKAMIIDSITVDPDFVDASSNNLSLRPTSPCIGAA